MKSLFNLASITTKVSVQFRKFKSAEIIFHIIYTHEINNIKTILVLRDQKKIKDSTMNPEFLIVGHFKEDLIPINREESIKTLELLLSYSNSELLNIGLDTDRIIQSIDFLQQLKITENLAYYNLSSSIFALIRQEGEIKNPWNIEIHSKHEIKLKIESFYFIGSRASNDHIIFTVLTKNLNDQEINKIHLQEDFYINVDKGEGFEREYLAVCTKLEKNNKNIKFYFSSYVNNLRKSIMGFMEAAKINPLKLMHLILRSAGFEEENINIEKLEKGKNSNYAVTVLIKNLKIKEKFGIGLVSFYPSESESKIFQDFSSKLKKEIESIDEKYCWARVNVESNTLFNAYKLGKRTILQSVDILSNIVKSDYIFNFYSEDNGISNWDRDHATPKIEVTTISNIHDNLSNENVTMDFQNIFEPNFLTLDCNILEKIQKIRWLELLLIDREKMTSAVKLLMNSIKWLNRSWYADNMDDKVIYNSIAMEFMVAGQKVTIPDEERIFEQIKEKLNEINCQDKKKIINRILSYIKEPSFKMKLDSMATQLKIPVSDNDLDLLDKIRQERNELFHGRRECEINDLDMAIANNIVFMMVIKKLYILRAR
jgi:hypothetical protein